MKERMAGAGKAESRLDGADSATRAGSPQPQRRILHLPRKTPSSALAVGAPATAQAKKTPTAGQAFAAPVLASAVAPPVSAEERAAAVAWLRSLPCGDVPRPLQIGIHVALRRMLPDHIREAALSEALAPWTRSLPYLRALAADRSQRVDVAGQPVQPVTVRHREKARALLAQLESESVGVPLAQDRSGGWCDDGSAKIWNRR